jgi:hypothetical protein
MAFNNHIGIYATMEEFQANVNFLEIPWVAYVGTPGTPEYKILYPDDLVAEDNEGVNIAGEILKLKPVICTEDEYEILITNGHGFVTDVNGVKNEVDYDPEVYYYTYDASELES